MIHCFVKYGLEEVLKAMGKYVYLRSFKHLRLTVKLIMCISTTKAKLVSS